MPNCIMDINDRINKIAKYYKRNNSWLINENIDAYEFIELVKRTKDLKRRVHLLIYGKTRDDMFNEIDTSLFKYMRELEKVVYAEKEASKYRKKPEKMIEIKTKYCSVCGSVITDPKRRTICSEECANVAHKNTLAASRERVKYGTARKNYSAKKLNQCSVDCLLEEFGDVE